KKRRPVGAVQTRSSSNPGAPAPGYSRPPRWGEDTSICGPLLHRHHQRLAATDWECDLGRIRGPDDELDVGVAVVGHVRAGLVLMDHFQNDPVGFFVLDYELQVMDFAAEECPPLDVDRHRDPAAVRRRADFAGPPRGEEEVEANAEEDQANKEKSEEDEPPAALRFKAHRRTRWR